MGTTPKKQRTTLNFTCKIKCQWKSRECKLPDGTYLAIFWRDELHRLEHNSHNVTWFLTKEYQTDWLSLWKGEVHWLNRSKFYLGSINHYSWFVMWSTKSHLNIAQVLKHATRIHLSCQLIATACKRFYSHVMSCP